MKKKIVAMCVLTLALTGCGKVPKLSNGDEAIVSFENGHMISANDLYENMKNNYALSSLINLVDSYIFETEFKDYIDDARAYAENAAAGFKAQYGDQTELVLMNYGFSDLDAYEDYVYNNEMRDHVVDEYAKLQITDEQVEKYYNDVLKGDVELSHILITSDVKDGATSDEKTEAENKAKDTVKEIIEKLKEADDVEKTFKELAKEYSKDEATKDNGGSLGKITYGDLSKEYDELLDNAYRLKDGAFSTDVITTELGYHVILKTKTYEKEELSKVKDEILKELGDDYRSEHSDTSVLALQHYRQEYGMNIEDDTVKKQYTTYITNLLQSVRQQDSEES